MGDVNDYERPLGGEYYGTRSNGRRRCCIAMAVGLLATVLLIIAIAVPLSMKHKSQVNQPTGADAISAACGATLFPIVCNETMGTGNGNFTTNSRGMSTYAIQLAGNGVNQTLFAVLGINASSNLNVTGAVDTCLETLSLAGSYLASIYNDIQNETAVLEDIQAALYGAWELHTTCVDTFVEYAPDFSANVSAQGQQADQLLSNAGSLLNALVTFGNDLTQWKPTLYGLPDGLNFSSIVNSIPSSVENAFHNLTGGGNRKLLSNPDLVPETEEDLSLGFNQPPRWLNPSDRRLLAGSPSFYNAVVAKDGSGHYKTIQAAISAAPKNKQTRWVIWVKTGVYYENVVVQGGSINLFLIGDGIGKTVISGNRNVGCNCGMTTFLSATLAISGPGFMMKGITVRNTAGAKMFQAVALRVSADRAAFFQCSFEAYQDTLYANAFRQYYSECMILGTVDFIFGNAAAVFQNCDILAQTGIVGQQNTYTAQGRTSPVTNTGISFQNCYFDGTQALHAQSTIFLTYLGRPWKEYAVCVHLKSNLGTVVNPAGWLYWNFTNFGLYTSFFAEYQSIGPGAKGPRVSWSHQITNPAIADRYQANAFIQGNKWVPATGFPYTATL